LVHPEDRAAVEFDIANLPPSGTFDSECRVIRPDGSVRWITAHSVIRYDARGEAAEMIGVNWDITAEKGAAEQLRINEARHRLQTPATHLAPGDSDRAPAQPLWPREFRARGGLPAAAPADPNLLRPLVEDKDWDRINLVWSAAAAGDGRIELEYQIRRRGD